MKKEVYGRRYSSQLSVKISDVLRDNHGVYVDTNFFASPFFVFHNRYLYLGGRNIIRLISDRSWNHLRPDIIRLATDEFRREADLFVDEYGKVKTVESVVTEWKRFSKNLDDAIIHLPQDLISRAQILHDLKRLRIASDYVHTGLNRVKVDSSETIKKLALLFGIFKEVPLDKFERRKLRDEKHKRNGLNPSLPADQELFAAAVFESAFENRHCGLITRDSDLYKIMAKGAWFFSRNSTAFTRRLMKRGPRIYHCNAGDSYQLFTFKNCKPAHLPNDAVQRLNGRLDDLIRQITERYEEITH